MLILNEMFVSSFGKLKDFRMSFSSGLNTICEDNGFGKTTIANFIKAIFFGLNGTNKKSELVERKKFTPWESQDKFGGYIKFEVDGKKYKVERYFGKKESLDTFVLYNNNDIVCNDFSSDLGYELFGIDEFSFERCLYIPQKDVIVQSNDSFLTKLNNLVDNTDDINNYNSAMKSLQEFRRQLSSTQRTANPSVMNVLSDKNKEAWRTLERSKLDTDTLELNNQRVGCVCEKIASLEIEAKQLKERAKEQKSEEVFLEKAKRLGDLKNRLDEKRKKVEYLESRNIDEVTDNALLELKKDVDLLNEKKQLLYELDIKHSAINEKAQPTNKRLGLVRVACLFVSLVPNVLTIAGVLPPIALLGSVLLWLPAVFFGVSKFSQKKVFRAIAQQLEEIADERQTAKLAYTGVETSVASKLMRYGVNETEPIAGIEQIKNLKAQFDETKDYCDKLLKEWQDNGETIDFGSIMKRNSDFSGIDFDAEAQKRVDQINALVVEKKQREIENVNILKNFVPISECENLLVHISEQIELCNIKNGYAESAEKCLEQAKNNLSESFIPKIKNKFETYLSAITGGKFDTVSVDDKFNMQIEENQVLRDIGFFSKGISEASLFCLRLSLIDVMFEDESPFLILDDCFVNFDNTKKRQARDILCKRAKTSQIIYFTCHKDNGVTDSK